MDNQLVLATAALLSPLVFTAGRSFVFGFHKTALKAFGLWIASLIFGLLAVLFCTMSSAAVEGSALLISLLFAMYFSQKSSQSFTLPYNGLIGISALAMMVALGVCALITTKGYSPFFALVVTPLGFAILCLIFLDARELVSHIDRIDFMLSTFLYLGLGLSLKSLLSMSEIMMSINVFLAALVLCVLPTYVNIDSVFFKKNSPKKDIYLNFYLQEIILLIVLGIANLKVVLQPSNLNSFDDADLILYGLSLGSIGFYLVLTMGLLAATSKVSNPTSRFAKTSTAIRENLNNIVFPTGRDLKAAIAVGLILLTVFALNLYFDWLAPFWLLSAIAFFRPLIHFGATVASDLSPGETHGT